MTANSNDDARVGHLDDGPRFVEVPPSRATTALTVAWNVLFRLAIGGAMTFGVGFVLMIAFDEKAIVLPRSWDRLDGFGRVLIGYTFFAGGMLPALLLWPLAFARDLALRRDLRAHANTDDAAVPIAAQRTPAVKLGENVSVSGLALMLIGGTLFVIFGIAAIMVDGEARTIGLGAVALTIGMIALGRILSLRGNAAQATSPDLLLFSDGRSVRAEKEVRRRAAAQRTATDGDHPAPQRPRERTIGGVAARMLQIGAWAAVAACIGVFVMALLRKPCRRCDPVEYADPVEWLIDSGLAFSASLTVLAVTALTVGSILGAVVGQRARLRLRALAASPDAGWRRPSESALHAQLTGTSPLRVAACLCAAWGSALVWASLAAASEAAEGQEPFVGMPWDFSLRLGIVLVCGLVLVEWIALREHVETARQLRRAWPVIDPPPAATPTARTAHGA
ncbi:MAG: hypothetical protein IPJ61_03810 [Tessaracoccus sp.]|uniref:hypothetical protein n=1 Tax=Tessaracoccus sp. TaxID=1971211 RepID=UPI001ECC575B|nr:hypothetical protein [Tessaracoccus sp.]MBK7820206.1 hypothetical protein [Tessaracoccus sp.]